MWLREATSVAVDSNDKVYVFNRGNIPIIIFDKNGNMIKKPGKLKYCKAVGWYIEEYKQAQVSINLTN